MVKHHKQQSYFYYTPPYTIPFQRPIQPYVIVTDPQWVQSWPSIKSIILSVTMLLCSTAIISLDIANIAIEKNKQNAKTVLGLGTATVGAGIWCGSVSFIAAVFIVMIVSMQNKRIAATFALIAVALALLFMIVLVGLIGNAVQINRTQSSLTDPEKVQDNVLIAMLSTALFVMILCATFFAMYIKAFFSASRQHITIQ